MLTKNFTNLKNGENKNSEDLRKWSEELKGDRRLVVV